MSLSEPVKEFEGVLDRAENEQIIQFLKQYQPSAHNDIVQLLVESTSDLPDIKFYCPDTDNHAYYLAHTPDGVIFAAAVGMSALMYRLPKQTAARAQFSIVGFQIRNMLLRSARVIPPSTTTSAVDMR